MAEKRLLTCTDLQKYLGVSYITAKRFGEDSGAGRRINKRVYYDRAQIDAALSGRKEVALNEPEAVAAV